MTAKHNQFLPIVLTGVLALSSACASFNPTPIDEVGFKDRAQTQTKNDVTVTVSVLSAEETQSVFDTKLYKKKIQPIWVEVANGTDQLIAFLPRSVDPNYHSALEVAQKSFKTWAKKSNQAKREFYYRNTMRFEVPPGQTRSGFVFGDRSRGVRWMAVVVIGEKTAERFEFIIEVPGFNADFHKLEDVVIYTEDDYTDLDENQLVEWIEKQPAFVTNKDGSKTGDPLNLIIIGEAGAVWPAFLSQGWGPTEAMTTGSAVKTGVFGIFGGGYKYAPISDLYVYGRSQDIALQKVRNNIHYRNHLRLWEAPVRYQGKPVLIGQISRDIGSRMTTKSSTLTTHRIDPDVDETRASLIQDFLWAKALEVFGYAGGVGKISLDEPRGNLTGDIFFTDGNRAIMLLSTEPVDYEHLDLFDWHQPLSKDSVVENSPAVDEE
jgi:LssY C-terminus